MIEVATPDKPNTLSETDVHAMSQSELLEAHQRLNDELESSETVQAFENMLDNPDFQNKLEEVFAELGIVDGGSGSAEVLRYCEQSDDEDLRRFSALSVHIDALYKIYGQICYELTEQFAPQLTAYIKEEATTLLGRIDERVIEDIKHAANRYRNARPEEGYSNGKDLGQILPVLDSEAAVHAVRCLQQASELDETEISYQSAEYLYDEVKEAERVLDTYCALRHGPKTFTFDERLEEKAVELKRARELLKRYHAPPSINPKEAYDNYDKLPVHAWGVDLNDEQYSAMLRHLRAIDKEKVLEDVKVKVDSTNPFVNEAWVRDWMKVFPAITFEGVRSISVRPKNEYEKTAPLVNDKLFSGNGMKLGEHVHDIRENVADIVIYTDYADSIRASLLPGDDPELWDELAAHRLLKTIVHEFAHALHKKLPVVLLDQWDKLATHENVSVTDYVKEMREHDELGSYGEDFADSARLYLIDPDHLKQIAPERFAMMQLLFSL